MNGFRAWSFGPSRNDNRGSSHHPGMTNEREARREPRVLLPILRREPLKLALERIDLADIGRDEMIAAALGSVHLEMTARVSRRGARAAEMDERREILLLARAGRHV